MKKITIFLIIAGTLLIITGILLFIFCYLTSDPEIEGESGRTPLSAYLISLIPIALGIFLFIISNKIKKNRISNLYTTKI